MPELSQAHLAIMLLVALAGFIVGWLVRASKSHHEKQSLSAGWQAQLDRQQADGDRLREQNKDLMEQVSNHMAASRERESQATEMSASLKEAFQREAELKKLLENLRVDANAAIAQRDDLAVSLREMENRSVELQARFDDRNNQYLKLADELTEWKNRIPPLVERYRQKELEIEQLEVELQKVRSELEQTRLQAIYGETNVALTNAGAGIRSLMSSNEPLTDSTVIADPGQFGNGPAAPALQDMPDNELTEIPSPPADLEEVALPEATNGSDSTSPSRDDLKQIKGVGPAIERTLNELGVYRYQQIADMSEYDIDRIAHRLKGFRSRIYREDWIGQARTLIRENREI